MILPKYFPKFESEDPIRSLKTVEVEKKKEKEESKNMRLGRYMMIMAIIQKMARCQLDWLPCLLDLYLAAWLAA